MVSSRVGLSARHRRAGLVATGGGLAMVAAGNHSGGADRPRLVAPTPDRLVGSLRSRGVRTAGLDLGGIGSHDAAGGARPRSAVLLSDRIADHALEPTDHQPESGL